jgi:DNA-binding ferritin-like protein
MEKCCKVAALYIATLKGMAQIHQFNHWTTKGKDFYGNHLLFERLYDSTLKDLDTAAEKFIGVLGEECIDYDLSADLLNKILLKYKDLEGSPAEMSLAIERDFIQFSKSAYDCFEAEGKLTLGLDDMIMAISSQREESVYLLQQALKE